MKTVIYMFHPHNIPSQVNKALAKAATNAGFEVRDMYALYPNHDIDVKAEQASLEGADRVILQFPMYWYSSPSLVKLWEDLVLEHGWAYGSDGTALHGKRFAIATSTGAAEADYSENGRMHYTVEQLFAPFHAMANLVGMTYEKPFVTGGTLGMPEADIEAAAKKYVEWLKA